MEEVVPKMARRKGSDARLRCGIIQKEVDYLSVLSCKNTKEGCDREL